MRRIITAISAAALAFGMVSSALPANAAAGFDSDWSLQTDYLDQQQGTSATVSVTFRNTGTTSWVTGTATQVDLAVCLEDKVTCSVSDAGDADFNDGWLSTTRYATHKQSVVAPGGFATFEFKIKTPATKATGTYFLNGDLVVSTTGERIHPQGYFHQQKVLAAPAASCTPTAIATTPAFAQNQVGVTHTQTATVTCDPPTGTTTRPGSANAQVTFVIDAALADTGNSDLTLTATTNADGVATVTWSRSNPGTDSVAAYPTSFPAIRATATKRWAAAAAVITCTPTEAATLLNAQTRTFTVTVRNPATGALSAATNVDITTTATVPLATVAATIAGIDARGVAAGTTVANALTGTAGTATFSIQGTTITFTPRVFIDDAAAFGGDANNTLSATEYRADCGATTFEATRAATVTVTPDTTATNSLNGNRVYTITAVDQFGNPFTGAAGDMFFSFTELTDADATTTTNAIVNQTQAGGSSPTVLAVCVAPTGFAGNQRAALPNSTGGNWFVQICSTTATTGSPIAWHDRDGNGVPGGTGEAQDTGGVKTWVAAAVTSAGLTPASATNTASSQDPAIDDLVAGALGLGSLGEERYTAQLVNQSGNNFPPTDAAGAVVTFTIRNTSSAGNVVITECRRSDQVVAIPGAPNGAVSAAAILPNTTQTCTVTIPQASALTAIVEIDRGAGTAGTATIDASIVHGGTNFVATQATKTWVANGTGRSAGGLDQDATGTVVAFDRGLDTYTISATSGNFTLFYNQTDTFRIDGTTATFAQFESTTASTGLSIGDQVEFHNVPVAPEINHALTNK